MSDSSQCLTDFSTGQTEQLTPPSGTAQEPLRDPLILPQDWLGRCDHNDAGTRPGLLKKSTPARRWPECLAKMSDWVIINALWRYG